jgi:AhpD family alkylhydroperoxidase
MAKDPKAILQELNAGAGALAGLAPEAMQAWGGVSAAAFKNGKALDAKTRELIAASLGLAFRCDYCIVHHVHGALKAGATREELIDVAFTTIGMSGGPAVTYAATLYLDSIEAFAPEFGK